MKYKVYFGEWGQDFYEDVADVEIDYGTLRLYKFADNGALQVLAAYSTGNWTKIKKEDW